jgi:ADP-ribosylglycohydrolase
MLRINQSCSLMQTQHKFLIGTAIGDAFGAGVEFQDRRWIWENVDFSRFVNARSTIKLPEGHQGDFTKNYRAWDYTDDTEMTVGVIKALCSGQPFTADLLVQHWVQEYQSGIQHKGFGRHGHGSMAWFYEGKMSLEAIREFQKKRPNPGNAPAMRAAPLGWLDEHLVNEYAAINANATHPNEAAILSSQCVARAAHFLLVQNGNPAHLVSYCRDTLALNAEYQAYFAQLEQLPPFAALDEAAYGQLCGPQPIVAPYFLPGIHGLPSDSKYTAGCVLYVLKHSQTALEALKNSVRLGGDVDSLASITTGILSALDGLETLPAFMLEQVEGTAYLGAVAAQFEAYLKARIDEKRI